MTSPATAEEEILVGRSAAGQIKVNVSFAQPLALAVSVYPGISGYATGDLGMHSTFLDDPTNDFFQLSPSADFRFVLVAKDPGMEVWNDHGSGYMAVGETFFIGPSPFDTHPIWNRVSGSQGTVSSLTLLLRDLNGVYQDSAAFQLSFTSEPVVHRLDIRPDDPLHATLLWTTNALGWSLEQAGSLAATAWQTVTNTPQVAGTNFVLSISTTEDQQFYRLRKP